MSSSSLDGYHPTQGRLLRRMTTIVSVGDVFSVRVRLRRLQRALVVAIRVVVFIAFIFAKSTSFRADRLSSLKEHS